jgi:hypothetical protein
LRNHGSRWIATLILLGLFGILAAVRISPWDRQYGQYTENHLVVVSDRETGLRFPLANNEIVYNPERLLGPAVFHAGTLLSRALGREGGYDGHVLLHWLILVGTACAGALIVFRATGSRGGAALAGTLALLHGRDFYINWIGVPNNYIYVLCTVAAVSAAIALYESNRLPRTLIWFAVLAGLQWLALGFYEAPVAVFVATPVFVLLVFARKVKSLTNLKAFASWVYPAVWLAGYFAIASGKDGVAYQKSVVSSVSLLSAIEGFTGQLWGAIAFWSWPHFVLPPLWHVILIGCVLIVVLRLISSFRASEPTNNLWRTLGGLILLSIAAIAPFAIVPTSGFMRTHLLAAPFVGAAFSVLLLILWGSRKMRTPLRALAILLLGGYLYFGAASAASCGSIHARNWVQNRVVLREIKRLVPDTTSNSLIVIRFAGIPGREQVANVLGDDMWLNMHVRSLYQGKVVDGAGIGLWASDRWQCKDGTWRFDGDNLVPAQLEVYDEKTIILNVIEKSTITDGGWVIRLEVAPESRGEIIHRDLRDDEKRRLDLLL